MTFSFKKFVEVFDLEDATDEQINELFGEFSNVERVNTFKAERDAHKAKLKSASKEKDDIWAKAKGEVEADPKNKRIDPKLKDRVWAKAKQRIETKPPQISDEE